MTREYPKKHNNDRPNDHPSEHPLAGQTGPLRERTVPISVIHEEEVEKAKADIGALVEKARAVELAREDPLTDKPEYQFIAELQDIFRQVHRLNARWLVGPGYEYVPPPAPVPQPGLEPAPPPAPVEPVEAPAPI